MNKRTWNIFVAISILLGSIFFGTYKRTLSSNLGEVENKYIVARYICKTLDFVLNDPDHCAKEYQDYLNEVNRWFFQA